MNWPTVRIAGQHNPIAQCRRCKRHALQTRVSFYAVDAVNGGPYLCDNCRKDEA